MLSIAGKKVSKMAKETIAKYKSRAKAKINRLKKKGYDVTELLDFDVKETTFDSRKSYNAWKRKIDAFTNVNNYDFKEKTNKHGVKYLPAENKARVANEKRALQLAQEKQEKIDSMLVYDDNGQLLGTNKQIAAVRKMKEEYNLPVVRDIEDIRNREVFEDRVKNAKARANENYYDERDILLRENWLNKVTRAFSNVSLTFIQEIYEMDLDDFVEFYYAFQSDVAFEELYAQDMANGDEGSEHHIRLQRALDTFKSLPSLKSFR